MYLFQLVERRTTSDGHPSTVQIISAGHTDACLQVDCGQVRGTHSHRVTQRCVWVKLEYPERAHGCTERTGRDSNPEPSSSSCATCCLDWMFFIICWHEEPQNGFHHDLGLAGINSDAEWRWNITIMSSPSSYKGLNLFLLEVILFCCQNHFW